MLEEGRARAIDDGILAGLDWIAGAAEALPYFAVTNLARTLDELKERNIWIVGADERASATLYEAQLPDSIAWGLRAEGEGLPRLTRERDEARARYEAAARRLSERRRAASRELDRRVAAELAPLKLDKAAFEKILNDVSAKIDTPTLGQLYYDVAIGKKDIKDVASAWLKANGFVQ